MAEQTKNKLKAWSRKFGLILFVALFLFNIKVALMEESSEGDFSLFGVKITLFQTTLADQPGGGCLPSGCFVNINSPGCQKIEFGEVCYWACWVLCSDGYDGIMTIDCENFPC